MSLENQCVSLEYAKKLHEIGIKQESQFYWIEDLEAEEQPCAVIVNPYIQNFEEQYSAFTAQELLDNVQGCFFHIGRDDNILWLYYSPEHGTDNSYQFTGNNLADLVAQMLIAQWTENQQLN